VRAHEVHPRADRDRRQLRLAARADESVRDLVQRPVAADRDDEGRAVARRALGQLDQVLGALGEERLALEPEVRRAVRERRPALARDAVVRRRVDEEDRAARANGRRP
jgi:hypothetical protein